MGVLSSVRARYLFTLAPIQRYIHPSTEEVDESDAMHHKLVRQRHGHHRNDFDICSARGYIATIRLQGGQTYETLTNWLHSTRTVLYLVERLGLPSER